MDALRQRAAPKGTAASKKKYVGSDLSSTRGSEERNSSVPVTGRGQKRGREFEMEKVGDEKFTLSSVSEARPESGTPDCFSSQGSRTPSTLPSSPPPRKVVVRRPMFFDGAGDTPPGSPAAGTTSPIANGSSSDLSTPPASPIEKAASTTTTTKPKVGPKSRATRSQSKATTDTKTTSKNAKRQLEAATKVEQSEPEPPAKRQRGRRGVAVQIGKPAESAPKSEPSCTTQGEPESAVVPSLTKAAGESSKRKRATTTEEEQEIPAKRPHGTKGTKKAAAPTHLELQRPETQPNDSKRNNGKKQSTKVSPPKQEESFVTKPAVKIPIPDNLKMILVDDWEQVTKNHAILPLPVPHPVNEILELYEEDERKNRRPGSAEYDLLVETVHGIKEYFAKCLGKILLYKLEREQYFEMRACWEGCILEWEGKGPGDIYGAEHLIRLFCKSILPLTSPLSQPSHRHPFISLSFLPPYLQHQTQLTLALLSQLAGAHRPDKHGPAIY